MTETAPRTAIRINDIVRFVLEIVAIATLSVWGFVMWPLPWPGVLMGILMPVLAILLWALFRSPKAVFHVDVFVKTIVELVVMGTAAFAWWDMGQPIVAGIFAVVAVVTGLINGRRELAAS